VGRENFVSVVFMSMSVRAVEEIYIWLFKYNGTICFEMSYGELYLVCKYKGDNVFMAQYKYVQSVSVVL